MDSEESKASVVNCCSKQAVETSCHTVLSSVYQHIDKSEYAEEFREGLKQRLKEIYENAIHDNVSVEGQTWSQAMEEGNTTKDYEPVNVELKNEITAKTLALDELAVRTTTKRRTMPPKVAHEVAKRMKHLRHTAERYSPIVSKLDTDNNKISIEVLDEESKLQESGGAVATLTRDLPLLEDKTSRLIEARELKSSMQGSSVYRVISRPLTDETKMATSMTPLRHRMANETPSPIAKPTARYSFHALKAQSHPINNNYKLRSSSDQH